MVTPSRIPVPVSSYKRPVATTPFQPKTGDSAQSHISPKDTNVSTSSTLTLSKPSGIQQPQKQKQKQERQQQKQQKQQRQQSHPQRMQRIQKGRPEISARKGQVPDVKDSTTEPSTPILTNGSWSRTRSTSDTIAVKGKPTSLSAPCPDPAFEPRPTTPIPCANRKCSLKEQQLSPLQTDLSLSSKSHIGQSHFQESASPITPIPGSCIFLDSLPESCLAQTEDRTPAIGKDKGTNNLTDVTTTTTPAPATLRKCQSTHVFFLNHYIDLLSYIKDRQERVQTFKRDLCRRNLSVEQADQAWKMHCADESKALRLRRKRTLAVQFQILTQVGQGGFGEVFLARKTDTNELCALKRMSKRHLHLQDEVEHILTERDVLTATRSEWHVKLLYSFQDVEYVYLAMEFVQGGDMRTMLTARGVLREQEAKVYFAEMVLAIDALHQQGYIHRDLKPENFLIDPTGHLKLTDFGLSKGQLAESRIEAMKATLSEVRSRMEPTFPVLRRGGGGGSSILIHHSGGGGLEGALLKSKRLGGAGGSFANLNGILHRSPSHLAGNGSCSNLNNLPGTGTGTGGGGGGGTPQQARQHGFQTRQPKEYRNEGIRRAFSIVGSADYMAPEILANKGYDFGVDYWSLGCILFEFLCGYSPFQAEDTRQTCVNVWHWRKVLQRPVYDTIENLEFNLSNEAWDLITRLITDREDRFTTVQQMKDHPWLAGLDWSRLRSTPPSFVPVLSSPMDTSYFDDFSNPEDMAGYKEVLMRQAQVQEAEAAAAESWKTIPKNRRQQGGGEGEGEGEEAEDRNGGHMGSLPRMLQGRDPWQGCFVGFTFRHNPTRPALRADKERT